MESYVSWSSFLTLRFAERLLCLRFLITTSCFLHFCRAVLALFRGSRHFGYRAGHIHQEPNRASFQIRQIHPLWSAVVCDCHGDFRVWPPRRGQVRCDDCAVVDSWPPILGLLHGLRPHCCNSKPGYINSLALGCVAARWLRSRPYTLSRGRSSTDR